MGSTLITGVVFGIAFERGHARRVQQSGELGESGVDARLHAAAIQLYAFGGSRARGVARRRRGAAAPAASARARADARGARARPPSSPAGFDGASARGRGVRTGRRGRGGGIVGRYVPADAQASGAHLDRIFASRCWRPRASPARATARDARIAASPPSALVRPARAAIRQLAAVARSNDAPTRPSAHRRVAVADRRSRRTRSSSSCPPPRCGRRERQLLFAAGPQLDPSINVLEDASLIMATIGVSALVLSPSKFETLLARPRQRALGGGDDVGGPARTLGARRSTSPPRVRRARRARHLLPRSRTSQPPPRSPPPCSTRPSTSSRRRSPPIAGVDAADRDVDGLRGRRAPRPARLAVGAHPDDAAGLLPDALPRRLERRHRRRRSCRRVLLRRREGAPLVDAALPRGRRDRRRPSTSARRAARRRGSASSTRRARCTSSVPLRNGGLGRASS